MRALHIADQLRRQTTVSVEIMPPRTVAAEANLPRLLEMLASFPLSFVSVTYGAGGSTQERTAELITSLLSSTEISPMAHLTCIAHTRADIERILQRYRDEGLVNLLALRGDPPAHDPNFVSPNEFAAARELVEFARSIGDYSVGVALHPEGHPAARSVAEDRDHQAEKLQSADFGITQFFFDHERFTMFVEDMKSRGVEKPIIAGIIAPRSVQQLARLSELSGAIIPKWVERRLHASGESEEAQTREGIAIACELIEALIRHNVAGVHLYTMNHEGITRELLTKSVPLVDASNKRLASAEAPCQVNHVDNLVSHNTPNADRMS